MCTFGVVELEGSEDSGRIAVQVSESVILEGAVVVGRVRPLLHLPSQ